MDGCRFFRPKDNDFYKLLFKLDLIQQEDMDGEILRLLAL